MKSPFLVLIVTATLALGQGGSPPIVESRLAVGEVENPVAYDMGLQRELYGLLRTISDKESADAAAPRIRELGEAMNMNIEAILTFIKRDKSAAKAAFMAMREDPEFGEVSRGWVVRVEALRKLNPPCYGSEKLREALKAVKSEPVKK